MKWTLDELGGLEVEGTEDRPPNEAEVIAALWAELQRKDGHIREALDAISHWRHVPGSHPDTALNALQRALKEPE